MAAANSTLHYDRMVQKHTGLISQLKSDLSSANATIIDLRAALQSEKASKIELEAELKALRESLAQIHNPSDRYDPQSTNGEHDMNSFSFLGSHNSINELAETHGHGHGHGTSHAGHDHNVFASHYSAAPALYPQDPISQSRAQKNSSSSSHGEQVDQPQQGQQEHPALEDDKLELLREADARPSMDPIPSAPISQELPAPAPVTSKAQSSTPVRSPSRSNSNEPLRAPATVVPKAAPAPKPVAPVLSKEVKAIQDEQKKLHVSALIHAPKRTYKRSFSLCIGRRSCLI